MGAVKRGAGKVMNALGNTRVGQAVKRGYETVRSTVNKGKARVEQWQKDRAAKQNAGKTPEQIAKEKQDRLDKARESVEKALAKGMKESLLRPYLWAVKTRYGLSTLTAEHNGPGKVKIFGQVNPTFDLWANSERVEVVNIVSPQETQTEVQHFFRAMSLKEFERLVVGQQLTVQTRPKKDGSPSTEGKGENFITTQVGYSLDLANRQTSEVPLRDYNYSVLVDIEVTSGALDAIATNQQSGRIEEGSVGKYLQHPDARPPQGASEPPLRSGRGFLVIKIEKNPGTTQEGALNFGIVSKDTSIPTDPINLVNAAIRKITVIGGIVARSGVVSPEFIQTISSQKRSNS